MDFRKHCPNCVVIIDCFEIFVDRPSALLARAQTHSSYKHHNTAKYLIGITPHGIVSFISNGWGGRVSDKNLTENCGLLNKLLPGDTVLADRGFDIKDNVGLFCATVTLPAYTRGKKQLSGIEVEQNPTNCKRTNTCRKSDWKMLERNTHFLVCANPLTSSVESPMKMLLH